MNKPTEADLERAHATLLGEGTYEQRVAQLIVDVRAKERADAGQRIENLLVEFADALGLINRFEGQSGYDRANVPEMLLRIKEMGHANGARIEADTKLAELVREEREFVKLIADVKAATSAERERCAKICDKLREFADFASNNTPDEEVWFKMRARGEAFERAAKMIRAADHSPDASEMVADWGAELIRRGS